MFAIPAFERVFDGDVADVLGYSRKMYQQYCGEAGLRNGQGWVHTHVHGCVLCEKESASRSSCLCSASLGGEGVLRPGCGSWAGICGGGGGGDGGGGEGESLMEM